jgi:hypothetical protein
MNEPFTTEMWSLRWQALQRTLACDVLPELPERLYQRSLDRDAGATWLVRALAGIATIASAAR